MRRSVVRSAFPSATNHESGEEVLMNVVNLELDPIVSNSLTGFLVTSSTRRLPEQANQTPVAVFTTLLTADYQHIAASVWVLHSGRNDSSVNSKSSPDYYNKKPAWEYSLAGCAHSFVACWPNSIAIKANKTAMPAYHGVPVSTNLKMKNAAAKASRTAR